ncbi:MAG: flagellar basal body P-ring formation protein FlgA [Candidatus Gastranaerophilales bacterium]|nr:flagellar basal body P-ring formation protein FlgA [Candidatus Gastranaerophilales bacterium]
MKKQIKNLILFLILAFSSNASFCYTLTHSELKEDILSKITPEIKAQLAEYSNDFKINILGISNQSIITNETTKPKIEIISQNNNFSQNSYKRILVKNSNGTIIKAFPINVQTQVYAPVLVASETIAYNQTINQTNTKLEKREISKYLGKTYSNQVSNLISTRNYPKGSVILETYAKQKAVMLKNSSIDIVFESKNMNIKLRGKALKDGAIGERILVKSDKYNKTYNGIIKSENEVIVRI